MWGKTEIGAKTWGLPAMRLLWQERRRGFCAPYGSLQVESETWSSGILRLLMLYSVMVTTAFFASVSYLSAQAQTSATDEADRRLIPWFDVSSPDVKNFVSAVGYIFSINNLEEYFDPDIKNLNFFFISKPNALKDGKISQDNLGIFDEIAVEEILKLRSNSDECFIQPFLIAGDREIIIAVNNSDNGPSDTDKKCFLIALAFFDKLNIGVIQNFDKMRNAEIIKVLLNRI